MKRTSILGKFLALCYFLSAQLLHLFGLSGQIILPLLGINRQQLPFILQKPSGQVFIWFITSRPKTEKVIKTVSSFIVTSPAPIAPTRPTAPGPRPPVLPIPERATRATPAAVMALGLTPLQLL